MISTQDIVSQLHAAEVKSCCNFHAHKIYLFSQVIRPQKTDGKGVNDESV